MWEDVFGQMLSVVAPIVLSLVGALMLYGISYVRKKVVDLDQAIIRDNLEAALRQADLVARDAIRATNQVFVDDIKDREGKLSPDQIQEAMQKSVSYFTDHMFQHSKDILQWGFGPIEEWITGYIEARIPEVKQENQIRQRVLEMASPK